MPGAARGRLAVAIQDPPLGTGHAVRAAEAALKGFRRRRGDHLCRRTPLLDAEAVSHLCSKRES